MMKGLLFQHQQRQKQVFEENMSNLTSASASGEASVSLGNRIEAGSNYPQQYFSAQQPQAQPVKKKRNLPGNPDPDAEVIALSPKTLMATNRFVKEQAKRRDSFITHRAFCDALAAESSRGINPLLSGHQPGEASSHMNLQVPQFNAQAFSLKKEQQSFNPLTLRAEIPPWLGSQAMLGAGPGPQHPVDLSSSSSIFSPRLDYQDLTLHGNPSPNPSLVPTLPPPYHQTTVSVPSPHMSATALLQKAAHMGSTMGGKIGSSTVAASLMRPHQPTHVSADPAGTNNNTTAGFGLDLPSREHELDVRSGGGVIHGLAPSGNRKPVAAAAIAGDDHHHNTGSGATTSLLKDMINSLSSATGFDATNSFDDIAFGGGIFNTKKIEGSEGLTRDFLGLRAFSHTDILDITGPSNYRINTSHEQPNQSQKPWQG
ncbi:hypothetical protein V6N13_144196 [Hibiscus sabdariffa]|uniref:BIRD-IDD transcription factor fourth C2HC zinc finger domain-containing protein n=1 Tax=Hibiscus sabdariffa TaxID=183260 RepID=A0ABR2FJN2_9ROSI